MKQRAHAWVALRAFKLLDDWGKSPRLVEMLSYYLADVWDGAWLPDILLRDMSYGHIFKMDSDPAFVSSNLPKEGWYTKTADKLRTGLAGKRLCLDYVKDCEELKKPYRTHLKKGGHLPSRVIALCHGISDMLKMGDYPLAKYTVEKTRKGKDSSNVDFSAKKVKDLTASPNFSARQIAVSFFVLSHYVTDVHMPLHCDLRDFTVGKESDRRLPRDIHPLIEAFWEESFPAKENLILTRYRNESLDKILVKGLPENSLIELDKEGSKYALKNEVEIRLKGDEWNEMVYTARVSYAVARKWIREGYDWKGNMPEGKDPERQARALGELVHSNDKGLGDGRFVEEFKDVTNRIFHDAVRSVARLWYHTWQKFVE